VTSRLLSSAALRGNKASERYWVDGFALYSQLTSLKIAGGLYLSLWYRAEWYFTKVWLRYCGSVQSSCISP